MAESAQRKFNIKEPGELSPRVKALRDYYFMGVERDWNNEFACYSTGTPWDILYDENSYLIVPETYAFHGTFRASSYQAAVDVPMGKDFYTQSIAERRAVFLKEVVLNHMEKVILPGDLLCGSNFNLFTSGCWTKSESKRRDKRMYGKNGVRPSVLRMHNHGYGNAGATNGHLIPHYEVILKDGFSAVYARLEKKYAALSASEKSGDEGAQLRAMMTACTIPRELAEKYSWICRKEAESANDSFRKQELHEMARIMDKVPWRGAETFHEAIQSLWLTHMLVMADENYPGPGVSFGRLDQILDPFYQRSIAEGADREFLKEILGCFWFHCNTVYDAQIRVGGNQGITAGFGQLFNLSGMGPGGADMTNDTTWLLLEVIDEMSPILEPKPNVRLHRNSPEDLLDRVVEMILSSQGAPFLLNFDERSMAGMLREAEMAGVEDLINKDNVFDYASVGCLENTMVGNDRSNTVNCNLNLLKAVELVLGNGRDLLPFVDEMTGKAEKIEQDGPVTGSLAQLDSWEKFWDAYVLQTKYIIAKMVEVYEKSESIRADFSPTPYLSLLVKGCVDKARDVTRGGAELNFVTVEAVTYATTVDSLLAVKYLVYDQKICSLEELVAALKDNWEGHEILQARAKNQAPKYGRDDDEADELALKVMDTWTSEVWKYKTAATNAIYRPGMLSWNYWVGDGFILPASPDGRSKGQFLSNAICPSNGADINGPTANSNSVGKVLGGRAAAGRAGAVNLAELPSAAPGFADKAAVQANPVSSSAAANASGDAGAFGDAAAAASGTAGDYEGYFNSLPNGASHTITFNTSLLRNPAAKEKFKAFLRGYIENGGTALQVNLLDAEMLKEAQEHPKDFPNLLVRVTGYNAYFSSIGRELQDEIIARESHRDM